MTGARVRSALGALRRSAEPVPSVMRGIRLAGLLISSPLLAQSHQWQTATPASVGINAAVLDSIDREIKAGTYNSIDRFVVIRNGKLVYDKSYAWNYDSIYGDSAKVRNPLNANDPTGSYNYFNPWWHPTYRRGDLHSLQSVTKTITSVIYGVARTRGDFPSIDTPALDFFDTTRVKNIDDRKRRMTVRHLLTMSGGIDWNENLPYIDPGNTAVAMEASFDWVEYTINRPMAVEPGSRFLYSSGETELLAHIFRRATGIDIEEYAAKHLFAPLGIERWFWKRTPTGLIDTEGGLYLEAKDLARIWNLWLQNGKVGGKQIISPEWVAESVKPALRVAANAGAPSYGLKWWLYQNPTDTTRFMWGGSGFGGQLPVAIPEKDLVVVFNGWNILPGRRGLPLGRTMERILRGTR
jgi:CubicO group peptidase (beta-lactamase class C family)